MRILITSLLIALSVSSVLSATNTAASANSWDVQTAYDACSIGDTLKIPAGTGIWTNPITVRKAITIQGAGTNSTILQDEVPSRSLSLFFFIIHTNLSEMMRITGIQFASGTNYSSDPSWGALRVDSESPLFRIDSCYWNYTQGRPVWWLDTSTSNSMAGVFDHNIVALPNDGGFFFDSSNQGYNAWATDVPWGTTNMGIYIESCWFTNVTLRAITDGRAGLRWVFRYNTVYNGAVENHELLARKMDPRAFESYGNTFWAGNVGEAAHLFRAGTGLVFSNSVGGSFPGLARMVYYRQLSGANYGMWGEANGTNVWDLNDETLFDSGSHTGTNSSKSFLEDTNKSWTVNQWVGYSLINDNFNTNAGRGGLIVANTATTITMSDGLVTSQNTYWTNGNTYQIRKVLRGFGQPGIGKGTLLCCGSDFVNATPTEWPDNIDEPIWFWGNTGTTNLSSYQIVQEGANFTNAVSGKPGYTPLVFPHPLVASDTNPPSATTSLRTTNLTVGNILRL